MTEVEDRADCCYYVLVEGRSAEEVAALVGGRLSGPRRLERVAARATRARPAIGLVGGTLPFDPAVLAAQQGPADDPRIWYRVAAAAVASLTNWLPGRPDHLDEPSFTEVTYPRPAGVALGGHPGQGAQGVSVTRDLGRAV